MNQTSKRSLERYKIFPYVAWALTIVFALFVYKIVLELQDVTTQLASQTDALGQQISNLNQADADFDQYQDDRYDRTTE